MDVLNAMRVSGEVARLGSFQAASRELRLSPASVSRIVAELEADLGVRLFHRTTRQLSLTEAGQEFLLKSSGLLEEFDAMRTAVRDRQDMPRGQLRVSSVAAFGSELLAPTLPEFMRQYPQIALSLYLDNRVVDLIDEHYDIAIRLGPLGNSSMIARKIFSQKIIVVATPGFCDAFGEPRSLDDLDRLPSITQVNGEWGRLHHFIYRGKTLPYEPPQDLTMSSARAVLNACLTGYGYALLPDFMAASEIQSGRLARLLPDHEPVEHGIYAFYAERRYMPQKIRVFLDYLTRAFSTSA